MNDSVLTIEPTFFSDPFPTLKSLQETGPARPVRLPDGVEWWIVTRYDDVLAGMEDPRLSSAANDHMANEDGLPTTDAITSANNATRRSLVNLDPPDHTRLRRLVVRAFSAKRIDGLRPRVQQIADELLDAMAEAGDEADLMSAYASQLPIRVICELLGVPEDHEALRDKTGAAFQVVKDDESMQGMADAFAWLTDYTAKLIRAKQNAPGDDLLSDLIAVHEENNDRLDDEELAAMALTLLLAGHETTVQLIGNGMNALFNHPDQLDMLLRQPELVRPAVDELLRYDGPTNPGVARYATEDVPLGGVVIPRGALVLLSVAAANRDAGRFERADELDITRDAAAHLGFGRGIHYCLGARLARLEGEIAIGSLLRRFPDIRLAVPADRVEWRLGMVRGLVSLPVTLK
ncbi:cytochrome P450 [Streptomyces sp. WAC05374]|uniref:cytochrome P450 family protein n=1 Tax=Streptomyces sp. WAC05374 TaxID=2487420 RepID=UPI000F895137|nr:cytochrome P450 [Streptomyces sp. WAC05374]RST12710.1 cytochrome P450 [Streptomyces sp. WAC05374]TDF39129.1 cytochrome P450 [Streptomyces sp. WAC05374]TDF45510.1 cytochrome P450 [Streptomyces sp. WAC05374]TDF47448.1 cytochrome P450 [Streptomyces sp. WAC05374]